MKISCDVATQKALVHFEDDVKRTLSVEELSYETVEKHTEPLDVTIELAEEN